MSTQPASLVDYPLHPAVAEYYPAEFWNEYYDKVELTDGIPVDSEFTEKEMRLLVGSLNAFWKGPGEGKPFLALSDVGLFYSLNEPPVAPDVMVGLVKPLPFSAGKKAQAYFVWEYGRPPDLVLEIVSNNKGGEDTRKRTIYEEIGVPHYVIHDPAGHLGKGELRVYHLVNGKYHPTESAWLDKLGLGVCLWEGAFESMQATWLRWHDESGNLIPTPEEFARTASQEAERAETQARSAQKRLAQLEAKLRELGVDPDAVGRQEQ